MVISHNLRHAADIQRKELSAKLVTQCLEKLGLRASVVNPDPDLRFACAIHVFNVTIDWRHVRNTFRTLNPGTDVSRYEGE